MQSYRQVVQGALIRKGPVPKSMLVAMQSYFCVYSVGPKRLQSVLFPHSSVRIILLALLLHPGVKPASKKPLTYKPLQLLLGLIRADGFVESEASDGEKRYLSKEISKFNLTC